MTHGDDKARLLADLAENGITVRDGAQGSIARRACALFEPQPSLLLSGNRADQRAWIAYLLVCSDADITSTPIKPSDD